MISALSKVSKAVSQTFPAFAIVNIFLGIVLFFSLDYSLVAVVEDEQLRGPIENLFQHYKNLLAGLLFILTFFMSVLGVGIYSSLRSRIENRIDEMIRAKMSASIAAVQTVIYNNNAFQWWRRYEPILQKRMKLGKIDENEMDECLSYIRVSIGLVQHGINAYDDLPQSEKNKFLEDHKSQEALVSVLNQYIYGRTAEMYLQSDRPSGSDVDDLSSKCDLLLELALGNRLSRVNFPWWEAAETVCFFCLVIGNNFDRTELVRRGKTIYAELADCRPLRSGLSPVPESYSTRMCAEYDECGLL